VVKADEQVTWRLLVVARQLVADAVVARQLVADAHQSIEFAQRLLLEALADDRIRWRYRVIINHRERPTLYDGSADFWQHDFFAARPLTIRWEGSSARRPPETRRFGRPARVGYPDAELRIELALQDVLAMRPAEQPAEQSKGTAADDQTPPAEQGTAADDDESALMPPIEFHSNRQSVPTKKNWHRRSIKADIKAAAEAIEKSLPPDRMPTFDEFWAILKGPKDEGFPAWAPAPAHFWPDLPRDVARDALNDYAPRLKRRPGERVKSRE
jgi:hypothetical protein